jgi:hypothetical protein
MSISPIFVNSFQKSSSENANLGFGSFVGIDTYSTKGLAKLTRDTTQVGIGVIEDLIKYIVNDTPTDAFALGNGGLMYRGSTSVTPYDTWTTVAGNTVLASAGNGLIYFEGYLFKWRNTALDFYDIGSSSWTNGWQTGLVSGQHFPFIFPNDNFIYFANGNYVGKLGYGTAATFNPGGSGTVTLDYSGLTGGTFAVGQTITDSVTGATAKIVTDDGVSVMTITNVTAGFNVSDGISNGAGVSAIIVTVGSTDYFYDPKWLTLPDFYIVNCMTFLPTNYIALGLGSNTDQQVADIILWNPTLSTYETPLRLYSPAGLGQNGVQSIINRNNVLYAVTGGNMCLFSVNGTNFQLVEDFSLKSSWRQPFGSQAPFPVFLNPQPKSIGVLGNKMLIGTSTSNVNTGTGSPYGLYPMGVWTVSFTDGGTAEQLSGVSLASQLEFPISTGTIQTVGYNPFSIGAVQVVAQNQALISWQDNEAYGLDIIDLDNFQTDIGTVVIESQMMEIGTPLNPQVYRNIELFLVSNLKTGQVIKVYGRNQFDQDYTLLDTFTGDGTASEYKITTSPLPPSLYLQIKLQMATNDANIKFTPLIRNLTIN